MYKLLLILPFAICVAFSCKNSEETTQKNQNNAPSYFNEQDTSLVNSGVHLDWENAPTDAVEIKKATIREGKLLLKISYGGGCKVHEFGIDANSAIMKSMPPKRSIRLTHNSNEDRCKAYLTKNIQFDIAALLPKGSDSVIIQLDQWKTSLVLKK